MFCISCKQYLSYEFSKRAKWISINSFTFIPLQKLKVTRQNVKKGFFIFVLYKTCVFNFFNWFQLSRWCEQLAYYGKNIRQIISIGCSFLVWRFKKTLNYFWCYLCGVLPMKYAAFTFSISSSSSPCPYPTMWGRHSTVVYTLVWRTIN